MKVLFNLLDAGVGGGQQVALGVAEELTRRGHAVGVVVPAAGPATERFGQLGAEIHLAALVSLRRPGVIRGARVARGYDLVYSHTSVPGEILAGAAAALAGRPHVVHRHIYPHFSPRPSVRALQRALYSLALRRARVIAVAEHVADSVVAAGVRRERIAVIPNGVVLPGEPPPARPLGGRPRVGLLGRLDPQKGADVFVRAAVGLDADLVLGAPVAEGRYAEQVLTAARAARVAVAIPSGPELLRELDVVVIPSRWEGHPLVLLEAMALGKAIVATAIPGVREVVEPHGAAVLVPVDDAGSLTSSLRALLDDPERRAALGARAREVAAAHYALPDVHARIIAELERPGRGPRRAAPPRAPR